MGEAGTWDGSTAVATRANGERRPADRVWPSRVRHDGVPDDHSGLNCIYRLMGMMDG